MSVEDIPVKNFSVEISVQTSQVETWWILSNTLDCELGLEGLP